MAGTSSREVLRHLNILFHCGAAGQRSDSELLDSFVAGRDQGAEAAFAALVDRHGAMVLGVCRRVLGNQAAAEDAFQATFLVLARKAAAIARREQLASWLHGVARRAALDARARASRQRSREKRLGVMLYVEPPDHTMLSELRTILDDELARLPERHRAPVVLCELEGLSRREAAARLRISEGTLSSRLARAKARLRDRLTKKGFALSAVTLTSVLTQDASAMIIPPALADSTIRVATLVAAGSCLTGVASTSVTTLTEGVLKAMLLAKLKYAVLGFAALALVSTGVRALAQSAPGGTVSVDRLKAVEQKLDRLLEVLGGSHASSWSTTGDRARHAQMQRANPSADTITATNAATPAATASAPAIAHGQGTSTSISTSGSGTLARGDVIGRVDRLERQLNELERRFGALERRLSESHSRALQPPAPDELGSRSATASSGDARPPDVSFSTRNSTVTFDRADRLDAPSADTAPKAALPSASSIPSANSSSSSPAPASSDVAPEVPEANAPPTPR